MKAKILGCQKVKFRDKDGESVTGVKIHVIHRASDVVGIAVNALWFPSDSPFYPVVLNATLGSTLDLDYGPKNKLMDVSALDVVLDYNLKPVENKPAENRK